MGCGASKVSASPPTPTAAKQSSAEAQVSGATTTNQAADRKSVGKDAAAGGTGAAGGSAPADGPALSEYLGNKVESVKGGRRESSGFSLNAARRVADAYTIGEMVGRGGFGEVRRGLRKTDGKKVAIKAISKVKFATEADRANMMTEVELMTKVRGHPNVVELIEWMEEKSGFFLIMELCAGGELMDRVIKMQHFSEKVASKYFRQMLLAVKHCHDKGVVHRDLKPENFMLVDDSDDAIVKLTDFGLSCAIATPDAVITEACGSAYYVAPEIFKKRYTKAVDVWALGINLYLLLSGTVPFGFNAESEAAVYKSIQRDPLVLGRYWEGISPAAKELVTGLLEKDPSKRYSLEQALGHPWVTGEAAPDLPIDKGLISSMLAFNNRNKFKKAALKLVSTTFSASDVKNLREAFHKIDADGSGFVTWAEMRTALIEAGMTDMDGIERMMRNMDSDGDGRISWQEFLEATAERQMIHHQNAIWWAFCEYDTNGDGFITAEEMKAALKGESPEMIKRYIAEFDANGDGMINYEEFMRMLLPKGIKVKLIEQVEPVSQ